MHTTNLNGIGSFFHSSLPLFHVTMRSIVSPFARRDSSPLLCSLVDRYNLKRKVSSLPAVSLEEFETRKAAALALSAEQRKKAGVGYVIHSLQRLSLAASWSGTETKKLSLSLPPP
jgi:hypothetical protein